ncbi:hypothetical protein KCU90_g19011, partial [Aureobasidium melanogenum]
MPSINRKVTGVAPKESQENLPILKADVELLRAAIEGSTELDSMTVTEILTSRSLVDLASIIRLYEARYEETLDDVSMQRLRGVDLDLLNELVEAHDEDDKPQSAEMSLGIRAELYKFNVYSGPSGKFKAHVDTPRSDTQVCSLGVCLPSEFEGGVLSVSHQASTIRFDWSASSSTSQTPSIQWVAFYSDCSHEVQEVTAGHRIALTYNLKYGNEVSMATKYSSAAIVVSVPSLQQRIRMFGNQAVGLSG